MLSAHRYIAMLSGGYKKLTAGSKLLLRSAINYFIELATAKSSSIPAASSSTYFVLMIPLQILMIITVRFLFVI